MASSRVSVDSSSEYSSLFVWELICSQLSTWTMFLSGSHTPPVGMSLRTMTSRLARKTAFETLLSVGTGMSTSSPVPAQSRRKEPLTPQAA